MIEKIEVHPFKAFVPKGIKVLIVGSFPGKEHTQNEIDDKQWFYGAKRNQFWKILQGVYNMDLNDRKEKQALFRKLKIGIADIIESCVRMENTNLDQNLKIINYNKSEIEEILKIKTLETVFFTSRFVEKEFKKLFPHFTKTDVLPSPSPRYFKLSLPQKINIYKEKLPKL
jgi:hypoxanthine-DNA glycosylase